MHLTHSQSKLAGGALYGKCDCTHPRVEPVCVRQVRKQKNQWQTRLIICLSDGVGDHIKSRLRSITNEMLILHDLFSVLTFFRGILVKMLKSLVWR